MLRDKQLKFTWIGIIVLGLALLASPLAYANDLAEIAANREVVIDEIVGTWSVDAKGWEEQFGINVSQADDSKLLALRNAESFDEVVAILSSENLGIPMALGDPDKDMVYTPVTPCRIVDTRVGGGGFISAFRTRGYNVYGNLAAQGGSNCPAPRGEPRGVHLTLIAVTPDGQGNLQALPFGASPGAGLSVNFAPIGTNLANAGTIKTAYLAANDITVTSRYAGCHAVINVLGYYYDAEPEKIVAAASSGTLTGFLLIDESSMTTLASKTVTIPTSGQVIIMGEAGLSTVGNEYLYCRFTENGTEVDSWNWLPNVNADNHHQSRFYLKTVSPGTKTYALQCKIAGIIGPARSAGARNLTVLFIKEGL